MKVFLLNLSKRKLQFNYKKRKKSYHYQLENVGKQSKCTKYLKQRHNGVNFIGFMEYVFC